MANPYNVALQLDDINMPIALTDSELDIIFAAARLLAVQDRDPFHDGGPASSLCALGGA
jgi:hypothetical protein